MRLLIVLVPLVGGVVTDWSEYCLFRFGMQQKVLIILSRINTSSRS